MSDIHGAYEEYLKMKEKIEFDITDTLYIVGDIFDRGAGTYKILSDIMANKNIILLLGNHEFSYVSIYQNMKLFEETKDKRYKENADMWENYISDPAACGSASIKFLFHTIKKEQREYYLDYLSALSTDKLLFINGTYFYLTHGSVSTYDFKRVCDRADMSRHYLLLFDENEKLESVAATSIKALSDRNALKEMAKMAGDGWITDSIIITGHTPVKHYTTNKNMKIFRYGNNINIDCGCTGYNFGKKDSEGYTNHLSCLCLNTMEEFYI